MTNVTAPPSFDGKNNFAIWSRKMFLHLTTMGLWDLFEENSTSSSKEKNDDAAAEQRKRKLSALHILSVAVQDEPFKLIVNCQTPKEAFDLLHKNCTITKEKLDK
ncbi:hypothetical protein M569_16491 [Genlisea aurea]|uniref:DUF4219 domain-containing protein n=1 Tax=Genlisea aurea TaxID=192259 RepID=S8BVC8_9LAMI|nr:hypothetical protein M569_16491 [Genlisea aurea]